MEKSSSENSSKEKLMTFNNLIFLKLDDIRQDASHTLHREENEHTDFSRKTYYGLSVTLDNIEHDLRILRLAEKFAVEEYRKLNHLD